MANDHAYAALMGDLVRSESSEAIEALHDHFNNAVDRQNDERRPALASPLTITLGDEFQGLMISFLDAVCAARTMRLELLGHGIECRFVIGAVSLRTPLNDQRAWNMMGPGLGAARAKLNDKRSSSLYRFSFPTDPLLERLLDAIGASLTAIERRWTETQRSDVLAALEGLSATDIAAQRNVSVHTVYKVQRSGELDLYMTQWHAVREALAAMDRKSGGA
ncbi:SatD family protein [Sphingomonas sp. PAMC 26605]|uniref:SatD family protein n=1 Tax=Sphingomonas sp. PAMC 26605 TaxID=1112214 RepID=UPI00026CDCE2|nr:SatD family protein [Sphingomonas sp. PAMC 26605]